MIRSLLLLAIVFLVACTDQSQAMREKSVQRCHDVVYEYAARSWKNADFEIPEDAKQHLMSDCQCSVSKILSKTGKKGFVAWAETFETLAERIEAKRSLGPNENLAYAAWKSSFNECVAGSARTLD